jgi:hypothetical protein
MSVRTASSPDEITDAQESRLPAALFRPRWPASLGNGGRPIGSPVNGNRRHGGLVAQHPEAVGDLEGAAHLAHHLEIEHAHFTIGHSQGRDTFRSTRGAAVARLYDLCSAPLYRVRSKSSWGLACGHLGDEHVAVLDRPLEDDLECHCSVNGPPGGAGRLRRHPTANAGLQKDG